jgi:hypothetical protein
MYRILPAMSDSSRQLDKTNSDRRNDLTGGTARSPAVPFSMTFVVVSIVDRTFNDAMLEVPPLLSVR